MRSAGGRYRWASSRDSRPEAHLNDEGATLGRQGWRASLAAAPFLAPALVFLVVFLLAPTLLSVFWGGTDKSLTTSEWQWIGLANLREAMHDSQVGVATRNTLLI